MAKRVFLGALLVTCAIHAITLTRSPPAWVDEVQILDYGRMLWPGSDRSYGLTWSKENRPVDTLCYFGVLISEAGYRWLSASMAGPRLAALAGAILAALAMRAWLLAAGISPWISTAAGLAFLWDPLVVPSYRGARVDAWSMAFMLGACWCIRTSSRAARPLRWFLPAGALVAASGLTWPSAIILLPLLIYEIYLSTPRPADTSGQTAARLLPAGFLTRTLLVGVCAAGFLVLFLLPLAADIKTMLADLSGGVSEVVGSSQARIRSRPSFIRSPWLPLAALAGVLFLGPRSWFVALLAALCSVVLTRSYSHRAVYIVPYFAYGFAMVADRLHDRTSRRSLLLDPTAWLVAAVLLWSAGVSLAVRTVNAVSEWRQRDPALASSVLDQLEGGADTKVLLGSWNLYYPLRARGWRYWGCYQLRPSDEMVKSFDYDYVIHDEAAGPHPLDEFLQQAGYVRRVVRARAGNAELTNALSRATRGYGPYVVYARPGLLPESVPATR